ncbi:GGDEF domain-containing protein [Kitasatospora viridis]|uniref:Diguanylate cyclase (GGDEF)-like protein n=1 Tax=Kitasatospora viridis TaxID=281105 RepID=A0A561UG01_9ACTN|nr:GGDEF domain-containing protein [Kitasatospora viridis]TWF98292.1 diguanylate cyclase (GGDEF)-like protein [Kitasatospora viridis]
MSPLVPAIALLSAPLAGLSGLLCCRLRGTRRAAALEVRELTGELARLREQCEELSRSAARDPLTGVWNQRHLQLTLEREVQRCQRRVRPGEPAPELAVVLLEIDGFEAVTAEHGRTRAQAVLRDLAQRLTVEVRRTDVLGHCGGTGFLVVLPDTGAAGAAKVAERLCWTVRRHRLLDWRVDPVRPEPDLPPRPAGNGLRAFAGTAVLPADGGHPVPLLRAADRSLAAAKRAWAAARSRDSGSQRHGNLSPCVGPGALAHPDAARSVAAVPVPGEVRS